MAEKQSQETQERGPDGVLHLYKNGSLRVFPNRAQADAAAVRTGGQAYQSPSSRRFLVRFPASQHAPEASAEHAESQNQMTPEKAYDECCRLARQYALIYQAAGGVVTIVHPDTQKAEGIYAHIQYVHGLGPHPSSIKAA